MLQAHEYKKVGNPVFLAVVELRPANPLSALSEKGSFPGQSQTETQHVSTQGDLPSLDEYTEGSWIPEVEPQTHQTQPFDSAQRHSACFDRQGISI